MATMIEAKTREIFSFIDSKELGATRIELVEHLNSNDGFLFSGFVSFDDLLQINILLGRLQKEGDRFRLTAKGAAYLK